MARSNSTSGFSVVVGDPPKEGAFIGIGQKPVRSPIRSWKGRPVGNGIIQYCGGCGRKTKVHDHSDQFRCQGCHVIALWNQPFFSIPFVKT